jgi:Zn-dependent protease/CBS domain-containing protein
MPGFPIARLLGFEVRVHWSWFVVLAFVAVLALGQIEASAPALGQALEWVIAGLVALGFFAGALVHDLAHAFVARRRGVRVEGFSVSFFGGTTPYDATGDSPRSELAIAAAGPLVSMAVGVLLLALAFAMAVLRTVDSLIDLIFVLGLINLALGIINFIPAYPLDGGRLVRALVWAKTGSPRQGSVWAARVGTVVGWVSVGVGVLVALAGDITNGLMLGLCGWFVTTSARGIVQQVGLEQLLDGVKVDDVMERGVTTVAPGLTIDTLAEQLLDGSTPSTALPVVRGDELLGVIGISQVRRLARRAWRGTRVEDVMVPLRRLQVLAPTDAVWPAVERIRRSGVDGLPVIGLEGLAGMLTRRAVALAIQARRTPGKAPSPSVL